MANLSAVVIIRREKEIVYQTLRAMEKFPSFLKDVKEITMMNSDGTKVINEWKIDIDGTPVEWRQETIFDDNNHKLVYFRMIDGDYEKYGGKWILEEEGDGRTRVELHAEFKWGVPGLEQFVGKVLEEKALLSLKGMLFALRKELHKK